MAKREVRRQSADVIKAWRDSGQPVPLQVMLDAMLEELRDPVNIQRGNCNRKAFPYAVAAAVYFHPKPQATLGLSFNDPGEAAMEIAAAVRAMRSTVPEAPAKK